MTAEQELVIKQVVPFPPRGGFADLFLDPAERKAFKLFKNHKHPNVCPERGTKEDDLRRLMFEAEKQAYEIATADEHLKTYSPVFYGARNVSRVVALNGRDIRSNRQQQSLDFLQPRLGVLFRQAREFAAERDEITVAREF
jgi:hypothetical protein